MHQWRWRIILAVIGFVLLFCSACLITTSHLQIERRMERETIPLEAPPMSWVPESHHCLLGAM